MKLLENGSYGYQITDRGCHSITTDTNDEKTHAAISNILVKRLGHINDQLHEVEFVKSEMEHKEPIFLGFFIPQ